MGIFWWKQQKKDMQLTSNERLEQLEATVSTLKREVLSNSMDIDAMRDKVLRKLQIKRKKQNEEEKTDGLLQNDGLDGVRELTSQNNHAFP